MIAGVCFQIIQDGGEVGGGKIRLKHEVIDQGELQEGPEQAGPSPSEAGLQVQLEGGDKTNRH